MPHIALICVYDGRLNSLLLTTVALTLSISAQAGGVNPSHNKTCKSILRSSLDLQLVERTWDDISHHDRSAVVVRKDFDFTPGEIQELLNYLLNLNRQNGRTQIYWSMNTHKPEVSDSINQKMNLLFSKLKALYLKTYGHEPDELSLALRLTSDTIGHTIKRANNGDEAGLHVHHDPNLVDKLDFIFALKGLGPRVQLPNQSIITMPEGSLVLMGDKVRHGSPDSNDIRLIIVGSAESWMN